jgi:amidohydrolase
MEYDALPGVGHGCGHCASGAMSLLAGIALGELSSEWGGEIHVIGTPDEEVGGGKIAMAEKGVFKGYDFAIMIHLSSGNSEIWPRFIALSNISMKFRGLSSHAASSPWDGKNALNGAMLAMHAIDMLRQHATPDTRLHGIIRHGGDAPNIVPDYAEIDFYVRGDNVERVNAMEKRVMKCGRGAAIATETDVEFAHPTPMLFDLKMNESLKGMLEDVFAEVGVKNCKPAGDFHGSSDIGHTSLQCPTAHPMLGILNEPMALHTREFAGKMTSAEAHAGIKTGAKIIALSTINVLQSRELAEAIKKDFLGH